MKATALSPAAAEINRLHAEVQRCTADSRAALNAALAAAWHAGQLLRAERARVDETMSRGAWPLWVRKHFRGSWRTAHRYMKLAEAISDVSFVSGLSLRQAYFRLGIATEPKTRGGHAVAPLPDYVRLATRLVSALNRRRSRGAFPPTLADAYRRDLRALYEKLQPLFAGANQTPAGVSNSS